MKNKFLTICTIFFVVTAIILINVVPAMANTPNTEGSTSSHVSQVPPLSDPSKANYNSPTIDNLLDPTNPNYDPSVIYGSKGTRFDSLAKTKSSVISSPDDLTDHEAWGTEIDASNLFGVYAYQSVYNNINLNSGDVLYAPTLRGPDGCPLEMSTVYIQNGSTTNRYVSLYSWYWQAWGIELNITPTFLYDYVKSGCYIGELLYNGSEWHAYLYDWNTSSWDGIGDWEPSVSGTYGWDAWEEYFMSNNWPTLPQIYSNYLCVKVGDSGNDWEQVTSTYGEELDTNMTSVYPHNFIDYYYDWYVGPGS